MGTFQTQTMLHLSSPRLCALPPFRSPSRWWEVLSAEKALKSTQVSIRIHHGSPGQNALLFWTIVSSCYYCFAYICCFSSSVIHSKAAYSQRWSVIVRVALHSLEGKLSLCCDSSIHDFIYVLALVLSAHDAIMILKKSLGDFLIVNCSFRDFFWSLCGFAWGVFVTRSGEMAGQEDTTILLATPPQRKARGRSAQPSLLADSLQAAALARLQGRAQVLKIKTCFLL